MKMKSVGLALGLLATAVPAWAIERSIVALNSEGFDKLSPAELSVDKIQYGQSIEFWADWEKHPGASKVMALYPGYKEATYWARKNGQITSQPEPLVFFFARTKTVLNRAASSIDLKSLTSYASIKKMVPDLTFGPQPIGNGQLVATYLKNKQPAPSFAFCNTQTANVTRHKFEINLDESQPSASAREPWCSNTSRSTCFEACLPVVSGVIAGAIGKYNDAQPDDEKKDLAQALQAEVRFFVSEAERGDAKGTLDQLTKIGTDVAGIVELNIFYVNQIIQYGKVVTVFQPDPRDANRTIMTNLVVVAIKMHSWKGAKNGGSMEQFKASQIRDFLKGTSLMNYGQRGLLGGVPMFTQDMTKNLANLLDGAGS